MFVEKLLWPKAWGIRNPKIRGRLCVAHLRQSVGCTCAHRGMWILRDRRNC